MWSLIDPDRLRIGLAALAGAVVYGVFTLATLFLTGAHVSRRDLLIALLNVSCAAVVGVLTAATIGPALAQIIPWVSMRDLTIIGFAIGSMTWEALPFLLAGFRNRARREAEHQSGEDAP